MNNMHSKTQNFISAMSILAPAVFFIVISTQEQLVNFFPDDAFYYLKTALTFSNEGALSFDGMNETNGFHPLYMVLVILITMLFPEHWLLHAVFFLHIFLICMSAVLITSDRRYSDINTQKVLTVFICLPVLNIFIWMSAGMESSLVMFATAVFYRRMLFSEDDDYSNIVLNIYLGLSISILLMTRLDMIIVIIPFIIYISIKFILKYGYSDAIPSLLKFITIFGIPFLIGSIYIIHNLISTGYMVPVSAAVKHVYVISYWESFMASTHGGNVVLVAIALFPVCIALMVLFFSVFLKYIWEKPVSPVHILLNICVIFYYVYLGFFASNFFNWYFSFPLTVSSISFIYILSLLPRQYYPCKISRKFVGIVLVSGSIISLSFLYYFSRVHNSTTWHLAEIAHQMDRKLEENSVIGVFDAGALGFFSRATVVNLDGLANNYDYLVNYRKKNRFEIYFYKQGITHFLIRDALIRNLSEVNSGNYERAIYVSDPDVVLKRENEVFRYAIPGAFSVYCYRLDSLKDPSVTIGKDSR